MSHKIEKKNKGVITEKHECPVCKGLQREILYVTRDRHYRIAGEWNVTKCTNCGLVQLAPMLTSEELLDLYPKTFYAYDQTRHNKNKKETLKKIFFPTLLVKDPHFETPGKILDYGCGTGWSLVKFRDAGWDCVGIEPSENAAETGRQQLGLDIKHGTIHTLSRFDANSFDYIRANHTLEHDPDVLDTIKEMRKIIKPNGRLLIGVPNIKSVPGDFFGKYWWYLGAPVHTYNFSLNHIKKVLEQNEFEIVSVRFCGNFTGILGSIQIYLNRNKPQLSSQDGFTFNFPVFMVLAQCLAAVFNIFKSGDAIEIVAKPR
jgi:SAM-dependent methyltransferase